MPQTLSVLCCFNFFDTFQLTDKHTIKAKKHFTCNWFLLQYRLSLHFKKFSSAYAIANLNLKDVNTIHQAGNINMCLMLVCF